MTAREAADAIRSGAVVRMRVGAEPDDPVLLVSIEGGTIMSTSIGGWSEGVSEPVCDINSDFLTREFLRGTLDLVAVRVPVGILEQAAKVSDEAAGEACARQHGDAEIAREEYLNLLARGLYAAARGEHVEWYQVTAHA